MSDSTPLIEFAEDRPMWRRPISSTVGRLFTPITAAMLGSAHPVLPGPKAKHLKFMEQAAEKLMLFPREDIDGNPWPVKVYPNYTPVGDIRKRIRQNPNLTESERADFISGTRGQAFQMAFGRSDHYNPVAHSIHLYSKDPAIALHELGHAADFSRRNAEGKDELTYTRQFSGGPGALFMEYAASKNAALAQLKMIQDDPNLTPRQKTRAIRRLNRVLGAAYGTYVGTYVDPLPISPIPAMAGGLIGQAVGAIKKPWTNAALNNPENNADFLDSYKKISPFHVGAVGIGTGALISLLVALRSGALSEYRRGSLKPIAALSLGVGGLVGLGAGVAAHRFSKGITKDIAENENKFNTYEASRQHEAKLRRQKKLMNAIFDEEDDMSAFERALDRV
jgi:hypothetical protein